MSVCRYRLKFLPLSKPKVLVNGPKNCLQNLGWFSSNARVLLRKICKKTDQELYPLVLMLSMTSITGISIKGFLLGRQLFVDTFHHALHFSLETPREKIALSKKTC